MTAVDEQVGAQESAGIEQPDDVSRDVRDAVDSRGDTEFGSSTKLLLERLELPAELAFLFCELAKEVLGLGGTRTPGSAGGPFDPASL